jgi:hypothetical protein
MRMKALETIKRLLGDEATERIRTARARFAVRSAGEIPDVNESGPQRRKSRRTLRALLYSVLYNGILIS